MSAVKLFSEEAESCPVCQGEGFTLEHDVIVDPGKFEGEPLATFHAYHLYLDGFGDESLGDVDGFGAYDKVGNVILHHRSDGLIDGTIYDSDVDAEGAWTRLESEYDRWCEESEEEQ